MESRATEVKSVTYLTSGCICHLLLIPGAIGTVSRVRQPKATAAYGI